MAPNPAPMAMLFSAATTGLAAWEPPLAPAAVTPVVPVPKSPPVAPPSSPLGAASPAARFSNVVRSSAHAGHAAAPAAYASALSSGLIRLGIVRLSRALARAPRQSTDPPVLACNMRVASLLLVLTLATACEPALQVPDRPAEPFVASGAKWAAPRAALDPHCGCVGTLPVRGATALVRN